MSVAALSDDHYLDLLGGDDHEVLEEVERTDQC